MIVKEVNNQTIFKSVNLLTNMAYNHFIYLTGQNNVAHNIDDIRRLLLSDTFYGILILEKAKILGYLFGEVKKVNDGRIVLYIWYIYVQPHMRHKKLGSKMMDLVIKKCKNVGIQFVMLICDTEDDKLMSFYGKYGFTKDILLRTNERQDVMCMYLM